MRGRLRVAMPLSFGPAHFAPVLAEPARRHPELEIQASYSDRMVDLAAEGFDAAIRLGMLDDSSLVARRIASFGGRLVASPAYLQKHGTPRTPDDLLAHEAVNIPNDEWPLTHNGRDVKVRPHARFTADNGAALVPAVSADSASRCAGFSDLPTITSRVARWSRVLPDYPMPEAGVYVVRPPGGGASCKVRVLIDIMVEKFGGKRCEEAVLQP